MAVGAAINGIAEQLSPQSVFYWLSHRANAPLVNWDPIPFIWQRLLD